MEKNKKIASQEKKRNLFQLAWTVITNSYVNGFLTGKIYQGRLKNGCVPGLNCYSCMGALGACPIGALQTELGNRPHKIPFYMMGFFMVVGGIMGRLVCGFLCPFGLVQDLLHKIPFPIKVRKFVHEGLYNKFKYLVLAVLVIILPMYMAGRSGLGDPYFCKFICPQGMLEGGIPHVISNPFLREAAGFLFAWKGVILLVTIIASIIVYRPFCKFICPLGAIYSLFNKVSAYRYSFDKNKCVDCGLCSNVCLMNVDPVKSVNSTECIRCGKCKAVCPTGAIKAGFFPNSSRPDSQTEVCKTPGSSRFG